MELFARVSFGSRGRSLPIDLAYAPLTLDRIARLFDTVRVSGLATFTVTAVAGHLEGIAIEFVGDRPVAVTLQELIDRATEDLHRSVVAVQAALDDAKAALSA